MLVRAGAVGGGLGRRAVGRVAALGALALALIVAPAAADFAVTIKVPEGAGIARDSEPVRNGIPLPKGLVRDVDRVVLKTAAGRVVPAQFRALAFWPDGSVKWLLVDFQATVAANGQALYTLGPSYGGGSRTALTVDTSPTLITVVTGPFKFTVDRESFGLLRQAWLDQDRDGSFSAAEQVVAPSSEAGFVLREGPRVVMVENQARYFHLERIKPVQGVAKEETWRLAWVELGTHTGTTWNDIYEVVGEVTGPDGRGKNYDKWTTPSGALRFEGPLQTYPKVGQEFVRFRVIPEGEEYRLDPGGPEGVVVEESGPMRVVIRAEGVLKSASGRVLGSKTGSSAGWGTGANAGGHEGDYRFYRPEGGAATATWTFSRLASGTYDVYTTWVAYRNRSPKAPFEVRDGGTVKLRVTMDQTKDPDDLRADGTAWERLGQVAVSSGTLSVRASSAPDGVVVADAVRVVKSGSPALVVDDGSPGYVEAGAADPLAPRVVVRIAAFAGRSDLAVSCQVRSPRQALEVGEAYLAFNLAGTRRTARLWTYDLGRTDAWLEIGDGQHALFTDGATEPVRHNSGAKALAVLGTDQAELALFQRYAEKNQPQRIEVQGSLLKAAFWPMQPTTRRLEQASQKTYEMRLAFAPAGRTDWAQALKVVEAPLQAMASPEWIAGTMALGQIAEARDPRLLPEEVRSAYVHYEKVQLGKVDGLVWGSRTKPERTVMDVTPRTWDRFGNMTWSDGVCNLHYDWPWSMLLHYVRTGDRRFFDTGEVEAWCRRDRVQMWDFEGPPYGRLARYEKPGLPKPTHTWSQGLWMYYYLTGDPGCREAALETARGVYQFWFEWRYRFGGDPNKKVNHGELRDQGWSIANLLNVYEATGERVWLDRAARIFRDSLLYMDQVNGMSGLLTPPRLSPLMFGYISEPLCRLHYYLKDAGDPLAGDLLEFLKRVYVGVVRQRMVLGGTNDESGRYQPLSFTYAWNTDYTYTYKNQNEGIYTQFFPNVYAYLYLEEGNPEYLTWARQFFKDGMHFVPGPYVCPAYFPGTNSKIHGWSGRFNQVYLYMEKQLAGRR